MVKFAASPALLLAAWLIVAGNPLFAQSRMRSPSTYNSSLRSPSLRSPSLRNPSPQDPLSYTDPFIGTSQSNVFTKWGSEGGVYPGAVAPWGYMQLTPETKAGGGYDHADSSIYFFSCAHHMSGYPSGSAGQVKIMPVGIVPGGIAKDFRLSRYHRPFLHLEEKASPGYYRVLFSDNNTLVEATACERAGVFRISFPPRVVPVIFVGGMGPVIAGGRGDGTGRSLRTQQASTIPTVVEFSEDIRGQQETEDGLLLNFTPSASGVKTILLKISVSGAGVASAQKNIDEGIGALGFDQLRRRVADKWRKELSVIEIADSNEQNKKIFYTALYHSLLLPWIISDAEGNYKGRDGLIHKTSGKNEYGGFSPWDTFRSLHPLVSLLFPGRQKDMLLSMMDIYRQTGHLPTDPMTGDHAVAVIVDSWMKGIRAGDSMVVYAAMKKSLVQPPFLQPDREVYRQLGYIPFSFPESVTRTVEYAYDDWALAWFAEQVMHRVEKEDHLVEGSYSYRRLFLPQALFLLPRNGEEFILQPGTTGYKEGDKWVYSYFVPQRPKDLVNLMGGNKAFTQRLDSALAHQSILFDNETVFHIPYLFNYSGSPDKTQQWVRTIMDKRFSATPGGLPGNDDLGSVSSWYVFSAIGIFPVCPGRAVYDIGSPVFRSVLIHLPNGKQFVIKAGNTDPQSLTASPDIYVKSLLINNKDYPGRRIPHAVIVKGGGMQFAMSGEPADGIESFVDEKKSFSRRMGSVNEGLAGMDSLETDDADTEPVFSLSALSVSKTKLAPHELFWLRFSLANRGSTGTEILRLLVNGREYARKNCLVYAGTTITDSIGCRLYPFGKATLGIEGMREIGGTDDIVVKVEDREGHPEGESSRDGLRILEITELDSRSLLRKGEGQRISFVALNTGGATHRFYIPVRMNNTVVHIDTLRLDPGEKKTESLDLAVREEGLQTIRVKDAAVNFKVYSDNIGSVLLDLSTDKTIEDSLVPDGSGFGNSGRIIRSPGTTANKGRLLFGKDCFVEIPSSPGLDRLGETITMMAWVYPMASEERLVDLFAKGDNHVLQLAGNKNLSFFAGGWGRGDCTVELPADWQGHWHHIAGVCDGGSLRVYIDGGLKGTARVEGRVNLSVSNKWTLGRNEEFPGQRIFNGYIDKAKVFAEPLTGEEIMFFSRHHPE